MSRAGTGDPKPPAGYLDGPARTGSRFTFWLGAATLAGFAGVAALGLLVAGR